jgi:hypothetical protein
MQLLTKKVFFARTLVVAGIVLATSGCGVHEVRLPGSIKLEPLGQESIRLTLENRRFERLRVVAPDGAVIRDQADRAIGLVVEPLQLEAGPLGSEIQEVRFARIRGGSASRLAGPDRKEQNLIAVLRREQISPELVSALSTSIRTLREIPRSLDRDPIGKVLVLAAALQTAGMDDPAVIRDAEFRWQALRNIKTRPVALSVFGMPDFQPRDPAITVHTGIGDGCPICSGRYAPIQ